LEHGVTTIPDRVLDAVLDQLPTTPQRRPRWPVRRNAEMSTSLRLGGLAAAVIVLVVAAGALLLGGGRNTGAIDSPSPPPSTAGPTGTPPAATATPVPAALLPGEFTACAPLNNEFKAGTTDRDVVSSADGDVTIKRTRGYTWRGEITATDPRFSGTHYYSWDGSEYTLASGDALQSTWAEGHRIENAEGAWHGSAVGLSLPDGTKWPGPAVLTGEGAYEGITAALLAVEGSCFFDFRGIVTEIPDPPVPYTGE
jgi:hypothetical protein